MLLQWLLILYCGAIYWSREWHIYTGDPPLAKGGSLQKPTIYTHPQAISWWGGEETQSVVKLTARIGEETLPDTLQTYL
jgi:hypothetical protein